MAGGNDTYAGALEVLMKQIATMKGLADANLPFLIQLETMVLSEIRNPERMMQAAGILPQSGDNPQGLAQLGLPGGAGPGGPPGMGGGMPGGMSAPPPSMMGDGNAGMATGPAPANPDEMRRILTA